jgi:RIO kinase 1
MGKDKFKVFEGVFDEFTLDTLETLKRKKYFDELGKPIKTGKEGDVYFAYKGDEVFAIKLYRLTSANFKKITEYIAKDFRFKNVKGNLRKVILKWVTKEFRNLTLCHKGNMNVPYPYKNLNNVILMEYIEGDMLKNVELEDPKHFFELLLEQMKIMINDVNLIHGDLSEFNILVRDEIPVIIDLGQGISIRNETDFKEHYDLYERDVKNVVHYFNKRYKLDLDFEKLLKEIKTENLN